MDIRKKVREEVHKTVEKHNMLNRVNKLIIAFSSGPDSVCLLDVLHRIYCKDIEFYLIYINHGLRPRRHLMAEENLTRTYALKYNIKYKIINVKVTKKKTGIEAAARDKRYRALSEFMKKIGAQRVVFGHNLDDVVETFFMNLLRGSGTRGLKSIPPVRLPFIRPLINLKKVEILRYLKARKLIFSLDETNRVMNYRRNQLRHKIIPELIKIYPELHEIIKREIEILGRDDEYFEREAQKAYKRIAEKELNHISLDIKKIIRYNQTLINRVVMRVIKQLRGNLEGFESKHFEAVVSLKEKESGKRIHLPKGLYAQREYDKIVVGVTKPISSREILVNLEKDLLVLESFIVRVKTVREFNLKRRKSNCEVFDLDKIELPLLIRNKRAGDYIETKIGKKKIKKIYNEFKIPLHKRTELMMLCDNKGILCIIGVARAFRGFIDKKTQRILVVECERTN